MMAWVIIIITMIMPRWVDIHNSIDGLDNSGSFNDYDYDDVIDIAQVARRGPSIFKMMAWIVIIITMIMPRRRDVPNSINVLDYIGIGMIMMMLSMMSTWGQVAL